MASNPMQMTHQVRSSDVLGGGGGPSVVNTWHAGSSGFAATQSITVAPSSGNTLVLLSNQNGGGSSTLNSVTDNVNTSGGTWQQIGTLMQHGASMFSMWVLPKGSNAGGITSVTVNYAGSTNLGGLIILEISGLSASPFTSGEVKEDFTFSTALTSTGLTNGTASCIYIAGGGCQGSNTATLSTPWSIAGTNATEVINNTATSAYYQVVSTSSSRTAAWSLSSSNWINSRVCCLH